MAAVRQRKKPSEEEVAGLLKVMSTSGGRDENEDYLSVGPTVSQLLEAWRAGRRMWSLTLRT